MDRPERWRARVHDASPGRGVADWLAYPRSLTARIQARAGTFRLRVLREAWTRATPAEARMLQVPPRARVWTREIELVADGRPVIRARTVVTAAGLRRDWALLRGLGTRPLGSRLFSDPRISRAPLRFHAHFRLGPRRGTGGPTAPARRARLERGAHAAVLTEVFLPAVFALPHVLRKAPSGHSRVS